MLYITEQLHWQINCKKNLYTKVRKSSTPPIIFLGNCLCSEYGSSLIFPDTAHPFPCCTSCVGVAGDHGGKEVGWPRWRSCSRVRSASVGLLYTWASPGSTHLSGAQHNFSQQAKSHLKVVVKEFQMEQQGAAWCS